MADLICQECEWFKPGFDRKEEIKDYMQKTELLKTHFSNQDCPKCGAEESTQILYRMCTDCGEAEVDCMCDVGTPNLTEQ